MTLRSQPCFPMLQGLPVETLENIMKVGYIQTFFQVKCMFKLTVLHFLNVI